MWGRGRVWAGWWGCWAADLGDGDGGARVPAPLGSSGPHGRPVWKTSDFVVVSLHQQQVPVCRTVRALVAAVVARALARCGSWHGAGPWTAHLGACPETRTEGCEQRAWDGRRGGGGSGETAGSRPGSRGRYHRTPSSPGELSPQGGAPTVGGALWPTPWASRLVGQERPLGAPLKDRQAGMRGVLAAAGEHTAWSWPGAERGRGTGNALAGVAPGKHGVGKPLTWAGSSPRGAEAAILSPTSCLLACVPLAQGGGPGPGGRPSRDADFKRQSQKPSLPLSQCPASSTHRPGTRLPGP